MTTLRTDTFQFLGFSSEHHISFCSVQCDHCSYSDAIRIRGHMLQSYFSEHPVMQAHYNALQYVMRATSISY